jgi:hypothetical protein
MALTGAGEGINEGFDVVFMDLRILPADCCFSAFRFIAQCRRTSSKTWILVDNAAMKPISKKSWRVVRAPRSRKKDRPQPSTFPSTSQELGGLHSYKITFLAIDYSLRI